MMLPTSASYERRPMELTGSSPLPGSISRSLPPTRGSFDAPPTLPQMSSQTLGGPYRSYEGNPPSSQMQLSYNPLSPAYSHVMPSAYSSNSWNGGNSPPYSNMYSVPLTSFAPAPAGTMPVMSPYTLEVSPLGTREMRTGNGCQDDGQCAEEGQCLDENQFGSEKRAPNPETMYCGVDVRPLLPILLSISTICNGVCMMLLQLPILGRFLGFQSTGQALLYTLFAFIYSVTLGTMAYCAFADPGQVPKKRGQDDSEVEKPARGHKSWQYPRPIRRYDHYCKWVANVIGLLNHREFYCMLIGLVTVGMTGAAVDVALIVLIAKKEWWGTLVGICLHLGCSVTLFSLAMPIFRVHTQLVSRNELAQEWKANEFHVVKLSKKGVDVPVNDLSDEEYNQLSDDSVYDRRRNPHDHGCLRNWFTFWCMARWRSDQKGDF